MFHCAAFNQLIEIVKAYQSRKFDEDITAINDQEGKSDFADRFAVHQYLFRGFPAELIKSLFFCYAGIEGISNKLKVDVTKGLSGDSFPDRTQFFGNNYRPPLKAKTFCKIFFESLDDFMLKVLLVAATLSLICEYIAADEDHYSTGKYRWV